jgi:hypothetical protein
MKYLIYELFSGVGLCNQLFSLETGIYLANILNRKLILIIRNPLCHCGKSSWDYGYLLNFFNNDFHRYLPQGFDVYYKTAPKDIEQQMNDDNVIMNYDKFSNIVFVDEELNTRENEQNIKDFCHYRKPIIFNIKDHGDKDFLYINKTNASRCFYNFYTTHENMQLMVDICKSIQFKQIYYDIANSIYTEIPRNRNNMIVFAHLRFGDAHKPKEFIERSNSTIIKNLSEYLDSHKTNMVNYHLYFLMDNKKNEFFNNAMKKYNYQIIDERVKNVYKSFIEDNSMLFFNVHSVNRYEVTEAIIEMILASKADEFIGYSSSTFSHYIQYLRHNNKRSCNNYSNLANNNIKHCRLSKIKDSKFEWIKYGFSGGHPVSWHYFFKPLYENQNINLSIIDKIDGFGSQLQACFSLIAYCNYKQYNYIHNPFYRMHHNDENLDNFPTIMNNFINLEHSFKSTKSLTNNELTQLHKVKEGYFVHGSLRPEIFYNEEVIKNIRSCYYSNDKPYIENIYLPNTYNVAIHIRRGDVNLQKYPSRFTKNSEYINLLTNMPELEKDNVFLHVFSEGKQEDFSDIVEKFPKIQLHLNVNIQKTFHLLVKSDLLIMSKSSFCYCAALLNQNKVNGTIIKNWWHKPFRKWL